VVSWISISAFILPISGELNPNLTHAQKN